MREDDPRRTVWLRRLPRGTNVLGEPLVDVVSARRQPGTILARVTPEFLDHLLKVNELVTAKIGELRFISPARWLAAREDAAAPPVCLQATDREVLLEVSLDELLPFADDVN